MKYLALIFLVAEFSSLGDILYSGNMAYRSFYSSGQKASESRFLFSCQINEDIKPWGWTIRITPDAKNGFQFEEFAIGNHEGLIFSIQRHSDRPMTNGLKYFRSICTIMNGEVPFSGKGMYPGPIWFALCSKGIIGTNQVSIPAIWPNPILAHDQAAFKVRMMTEWREQFPIKTEFWNDGQFPKLENDKFVGFEKYPYPFNEGFMEGYLEVRIDEGEPKSIRLLQNTMNPAGNAKSDILKGAEWDVQIENRRQVPSVSEYRPEIKTFAVVHDYRVREVELKPLVYSITNGNWLPTSSEEFRKRHKSAAAKAERMAQQKSGGKNKRLLSYGTAGGIAVMFFGWFYYKSSQKTKKG